MTATEPLRDGEGEKVYDLAVMLREFGWELREIATRAQVRQATEEDIKRAAEIEESLETSVLNIPARLAPYLSYALALLE